MLSSALRDLAPFRVLGIEHAHGPVGSIRYQVTVNGIRDIDIRVADPLCHVGNRYATGKKSRHESVTETMRSESAGNTCFPGLALERVQVGVVLGENAVAAEQVAVRQSLHHVPQVAGNGNVPVLAQFSCAQEA